MKIRYLLLLIALFLATSTNAQNIKTHSGEMSKPEWLADLIGEGYFEGNGSYSYYEDSDETRIPHGNFTLTFTKNALFSSIFKEIITGSFSHGKRNGQWTMKSVDVKGKVFHQYKFQYKNGVLNGPFSYTENDGSSITCSFNNGVLSGYYKDVDVVAGYTHTTSGNVDNEGRPHGEWTIISKGPNIVPKNKTRLYYKGCLVYYREKDQSTGKITYENQISPNICSAADISKIHDTLINGVAFVDVGGVICGKKEKTTFSVGEFIGNLSNIYPLIKNWNVEFDPAAYENSIPDTDPEFIGGVAALNQYIEKIISNIHLLPKTMESQGKFKFLFTLKKMAPSQK